MDRFRLKPFEIENMTDRQIQEVYFHPREKDGTITTPTPVAEAKADEPITEESMYRDLLTLKGAGLPESEYERLRQEVWAKYHGEAEAVQQQPV